MSRRPRAHHRASRLAPASLALAALFASGCGGGSGEAEPAEAPASTVAEVPESPAAAAPKSAASEPESAASDPKSATSRPPAEVASLASSADEAAAPAKAVPAPPIEPTPVEPESEELFEGPLVLNGETYTVPFLQRALVRGSLGTGALEMAKVRIFIEEEIERQIAAGAPPERFAVSEDEIDESIAAAEQKVEEEYPDQDVDLEALIQLSGDDLRSRAKVMNQFHKVFFPENPDELPSTTLEALTSTTEGAELLDYLKKTYDQRKVMTPEQKRSPSNQMLKQLLYQEVYTYLDNLAEVELGDDLPPDVVMRVNDRPVPMADLWPYFEDRASSQEAREAKLWVARTKLLEAALKDAGFWLNDEEAAAAYAAHSEPYKDSIFSIERLAVVLKKFPSVETYKHYKRIYDSFEKMIADELTEENLRAHGAARTDHLLGQRRVDVDIILVSAYDFEERRWKPNGWNEAAARAKDVLRILVEEKRPWDRVLEEHSEFYDPPRARSDDQTSLPTLNGGRLRSQARNQLMTMLEESEYGAFLTGGTVTDYVFFEQEEGEVAAPKKGPYGWYIPKLLARTPTPETLSMDQETLFDMYRQDYVTTRLLEYTDELVAEAEIVGL